MRDLLPRGAELRPAGGRPHVCEAALDRNTHGHCRCVLRRDATGALASAATNAFDEYRVDQLARQGSGTGGFATVAPRRAAAGELDLVDHGAAASLTAVSIVLSACATIVNVG